MGTKYENSKFTGGLWGLIGVRLGQGVIILFTLGLGTPWAVCIKERWWAKHTQICGCTLSFNGTGWQLLGSYIKWGLLTLITLGIYGLWLPIKMQNWTLSHTYLIPEATAVLVDVRRKA